MRDARAMRANLSIRPSVSGGLSSTTRKKNVLVLLLVVLVVVVVAPLVRFGFGSVRANEYAETSTSPVVAKGGCR